MLRVRTALAWAGSALLAFAACTGPVAQVAAQSLTHPSGKISNTYDSLTAYMLFDEYGWRAMNKGWYDSAQRDFTTAIKVAQRPGFASPQILARSYAALAWSLHKQGRNAEAEPLARWALETRQSLFAPNAEPVARSLNQVATIYLSLNRFAEAEPLLRQVTAMDQGQSPTMPLELAQGASLLGLSMVAQRRYDEGEVQFGKAVALRLESQGANHPEAGDELNNLAWSQIEQGKLTEARATMDQAFKILGRSRGDNDLSVARALDGLARIDLEQKDLGAAETKLRRLILIYEKAGPSQYDRLRDGLKRYAELLDRLNRTDDARQIRTRLAGVGGKPDDRARASDDGNFITPKYPTAPVPMTAPTRRRS